MTDYRFVVRHIGYWRGAPHTWTTSYGFTGSGGATPDAAACSTLLSKDSAMCYSSSSGSVQGGAYECEVYASGGGVPIASYVAFDHTTPSSWVAYSASAWATKTTSAENIMEVALLVEWPAGVSRTGKAVKFRKWFHAVKASSVTPPAHDVSTADVTALTTGAMTLQSCLSTTYNLSLGNSRTLVGSPTVQPFYSNHQMPKGRRRKALVTAGGRYTGPTVDVPGPIEAD
uniref:Uncharacterized protein n=1 Tax=uncultured prokaryote TaxID=198431 RepID=A0A0H5Q264_9ZZZZ|nr:hypothetical protein [uncultured prokaryote]